MNKIKVLIEGYAKETASGWLASSTTTLILTDKHKIIVDPGINKKLLLRKLGKENLTVEEIDYVFLTHYHPDHMLLAGIFGNATYFDGDTIYEEDKETEYEGKLPDTDIEVIATPGHAHEHACLVVPTKKYGTVVVAGDVTWWLENEAQEIDTAKLISKKDPFTKDLDALIESRKKVLEIADWIIPGHGKMFRVERKTK